MTRWNNTLPEVLSVTMTEARGQFRIPYPYQTDEPVPIASAGLVLVLVAGPNNSKRRTLLLSRICIVVDFVPCITTNYLQRSERSSSQRMSMRSVG